MLLLHVDGNLNLYVNVIQQTGYHHQSYFLTHTIQQNYANLVAVQTVTRTSIFSNSYIL